MKINKQDVRNAILKMGVYRTNFGKDMEEIILMEDLKKQIPKKMEIGNDNGRPRRMCGSCGCFVLPSSNYCSKCGQKLDWD